MDVAERLVERWQCDDVRRRVPALDVGARALPDHAGGDPEPLGQRAVGASVAFAEHDEPARPVAEPTESLDEECEPLPFKAAAGEQDDPRVRRRPDALEDTCAVARAVVWMEALEVDTVVHHAQAGRWHTVQPLDLVQATTRD